LFKLRDRSFFVHAFAKSDAENIKDIEVQFYKEAAKIVAEFTDQDMDALLRNGTYQEINCDD
jgi:hypothetical protein